MSTQPAHYRTEARLQANAGACSGSGRRRKTRHSLLRAHHPVGGRPKEPLPREWYSFAVLNDAYVEDVPNREIMARLYISEGTFNRTRRNAVRALARAVLEVQLGA